MVKKITLLLIAFFLTGCAAPVGSQAQIQLCLDFLHSYGIQADPVPIEESRVLLPGDLDPVYEHYEELIAKDGFSLLPYLGKEVTRLTFSVTNYPDRQDVRANLLLYRNTIIAGDLSTVSFYGFMESFSDFPS
ncbi:MAG: DUF4830 domain-containing protein [Clostridia bacterium]|nr:DUF4830 domain-containing protein [Clostridia bacterium]